MNRSLASALRSASWLTLAVGILAFPTAAARAQYFGGGYGYGVPGYGLGGGYGFPGYGGGFGYPGYGFGIGGYGYPGYGFGGGYGYGGFGGNGLYNAGYYGVGPSVAPGYPSYGYGYGASNPLFGLGLSPLGVQSALSETYIIRGSGGYRPRYGAVYPGVGSGRYGVYRP